MPAPTCFRYDRLGLPVNRPLLHETAATFVEDEYQRGKGQVPFLWLLGRGTGIFWLETPWADDREKAASLVLLRAMIDRFRIDAVAQIAEAWVGQIKGDPKLVQWVERHGVSSLPPKLRDDVVFVASHDRNGGFAMTRYMVTDRHGKGPNFLGPRVDETDLGHMEGQMFNLFGSGHG